MLREKPEGSLVLYQDETDLHWNPRIQRTYQPIGEQIRIPAAGQNQKAYAFGTVDAHSDEAVVFTYERKRSKEFVSSLRALREAYPEPFLYLILDNYVIHKTQRVEEFLEEDGHMELVFLPTYSPDLNRMEDVWRSFHAHVTKNHLYPSMKDLLEATEAYFGPMEPAPQEIRLALRRSIMMGTSSFRMGIGRGPIFWPTSRSTGPLQW